MKKIIFIDIDGTLVDITLEQCKRIVDWLHSQNLEFYLESNATEMRSKRWLIM